MTPENQNADHLFSGLNVKYELDVPLAPLTWYGLGGPAKVMVHPSSKSDLSAVIKRCWQDQWPVYVLGSGANLLVADSGVDGVVIQLDDPEFKQVEFNPSHMTAGAGVDLPQLVLQTARAGLEGIECLSGIPATVGGAVRMNAGGVFGDIGKSIHQVQVMDDHGMVSWRHHDNLKFNYRKTNISELFILAAQFALTPQDPQSVKARIKEIFQFKKKSQPLAANSCGCAFKNPLEVPANVPKSAGMLIDRAGLKGHQIGGAKVSDQHANFVIANDGASTSDVLALLEHIGEVVYKQFGIRLEREIVVWP